MLTSFLDKDQSCAKGHSVAPRLQACSGSEPVVGLSFGDKLHPSALFTECRETGWTQKYATEVSREIETCPSLLSFFSTILRPNSRLSLILLCDLQTKVLLCKLFYNFFYISQDLQGFLTCTKNYLFWFKYTCFELYFCLSHALNAGFKYICICWKHEEL